MNINQDLYQRENWEKSSYASGVNSTYQQSHLNIKDAFSKFLPKPKLQFEITSEQIQQMEADILMTDEQQRAEKAMR
jgi:hypothetical protein